MACRCPARFPFFRALFCKYRSPHHPPYHHHHHYHQHCPQYHHDHFPDRHFHCLFINMQLIATSKFSSDCTPFVLLRLLCFFFKVDTNYKDVRKLNLVGLFQAGVLFFHNVFTFWNVLTVIENRYWNTICDSTFLFPIWETYLRGDDEAPSPRAAESYSLSPLRYATIQSQNCEKGGIWNISRYETIWNNMKQYETIWNNMKQYETVWNNMKQYETIWNNMKQYETIWNNMKQYETVWSSMKQYETIWNNMKNIEKLGENRTIENILNLTFSKLWSQVSNRNFLPWTWMTLRYPYVAVSVWYFGWPHKFGVWMCLVSKPMSVQDANGAMKCQLMFDDGFW